MISQGHDTVRAEGAEASPVFSPHSMCTYTEAIVLLLLFIATHTNEGAME